MFVDKTVALMRTVNITQWATKNLEICKSMTNLSPVVLWQTPTFRQQVFLQCSLTQSQLIPETTWRTALILINMNINYRHLIALRNHHRRPHSCGFPRCERHFFFPWSPLVHSTKAPCITKPNLSHPLLIYESFKSYKSLQVLGWRGSSFSKS